MILIRARLDLREIKLKLLLFLKLISPKASQYSESTVNFIVLDPESRGSLTLAPGSGISQGLAIAPPSFRNCSAACDMLNLSLIMQISGSDYFVYILANYNNTTLYIGCTHDLYQRMIDHKLKLVETSFSARYNLGKLVYYEAFSDRDEAYQREAQLKAWRRVWKDELIDDVNPERRDLIRDLFPDFGLDD